MAGRWRRIFSEVWRFLAVGGVATVVALLLFNFLVHGVGLTGGWLHHRPISAYVLANLIGMSISYRGARHWVFAHRRTAHPDGGRTAYLVINVATMAIPVALLWFSRNVLELDDPVSDNIAANVVGLGLGNVARFYLFRKVVFRHPRNIDRVPRRRGLRRRRPRHPGLR